MYAGSAPELLSALFVIGSVGFEIGDVFIGEFLGVVLGDPPRPKSW